MKKTRLEYVGFLLPLILAAICIVSVTQTNHQSMLPIPMPQEFIGEYSYDGETWTTLTGESELSALEGDLFLRGTFLREMMEGWQLNFYANHIGVEIKVNGQPIYQDDLLSIPDIDPELFASICARRWVGTIVPDIGTEDVIEIQLHNPHFYGNKTAYRDFLTTLCSDPVEWSILELNLAAESDQFRTVGTLFIATSLMLLGAAMVAVILRIAVGSMLLKVGFMTLFAGCYVIFGALDVAYWNELNVVNTYAEQLCMMLAAFCLCHFVSDALTETKRRIGKAAVTVSAMFNCALILASFMGVTVIYDTLPYWAVMQVILSVLFMVLCALELRNPSGKKLRPTAAIVLFGAILMDMAGLGSTIVWRAPCSKIVFMVLFLVYIVVAGNAIITNYYESLRTETLEKELEDSRIAIMISQIQPHFLYNSLTSIMYLCDKEPKQAKAAIADFADYLRVNLASLRTKDLVSLQAELKHVAGYLRLEKLRFNEALQIEYDIQCIDFMVPSLSIQPLVENAVKHGLGRKSGGGTVTIHTSETETDYLVKIIDDGVGFEEGEYALDSDSHIGLENIRNRLERMIGARLDIQSEKGTGTTACIWIPKRRD